MRSLFSNLSSSQPKKSQKLNEWFNHLTDSFETRIIADVLVNLRYLKQLQA